MKAKVNSIQRMAIIYDQKLEPCHIHVLLEQNIPNYNNFHYSSIID